MMREIILLVRYLERLAEPDGLILGFYPRLATRIAAIMIMMIIIAIVA